MGYLLNKAENRMSFAVIKAMSDLDNARAVKQLLDRSEDRITAAVALTDAFHTAALDGATGDFLMSLVSVVPDPFAAE